MIPRGETDLAVRSAAVLVDRRRRLPEIRRIRVGPSTSRSNPVRREDVPPQTTPSGGTCCSAHGGVIAAGRTLSPMQRQGGAIAVGVGFDEDDAPRLQRIARKDGTISHAAVVVHVGFAFVV